MRTPWIVLLVLAASHDAPSQTWLALDDGGGGTPVLHEFGPTGAPVGRCPTPPGAFAALPLGATQSGLAYVPGSASPGYVVVTDGVANTSLDLQCNVLQSCATAFQVWAAIAVDPRTNHLFAAGGSSIVETALGCPQGGTMFARAMVPPPFGALTGIAVDAFSGDLWVVDAGGFVGRVQFVGSWACRVVASFPLVAPPGAPAPRLPITSLAHDACTGTLIVSDGAGWLFVLTTTGAPVRAFPAPGLAPGATLVALARRPAQPIVLGTGCLPPPCAPCTPRAFTIADATIPQPSFRVELGGTAPQSRAALLFDVQPGPVVIGLCAPLQVGPGAIVFPTRTTQGFGPCGGNAFEFLPIPFLPAACGARAYVQWAVLCPAGAVGLSNGLALTLS